MLKCSLFLFHKGKSRKRLSSDVRNNSTTKWLYVWTNNTCVCVYSERTGAFEDAPREKHALVHTALHLLSVRTSENGIFQAWGACCSVTHDKSSDSLLLERRTPLVRLCSFSLYRLLSYLTPSFCVCVCCQKKPHSALYFSPQRTVSYYL